MSNILTGENLYKEFIEFRHDFISRALKDASATSTNKNGEQFRPVVIVPERRAERILSDIKRWEDYATELRKYPELSIPVSLYEPAPKYIMGANRIRCYELPATNVSKSTRENVISNIKSEIARFSDVEDTKSYVQKLQDDLALIEALPPKTELRMRRTGYSDLCCTYNTPTEKNLLVRATASGLFFDDRVLRYGFTFGPKEKNKRRSIYESINPLPLTVYRGIDVYVLSEVEAAKAAEKKYREENADQLKRDAWSKTNERRRVKAAQTKASAKGSKNAAGEMDPTGNNPE